MRASPTITGHHATASYCLTPVRTSAHQVPTSHTHHLDTACYCLLMSLTLLLPADAHHLATACYCLLLPADVHHPATACPQCRQQLSRPRGILSPPWLLLPSCWSTIVVMKSCPCWMSCAQLLPLSRGLHHTASGARGLQGLGSRV